MQQKTVHLISHAKDGDTKPQVKLAEMCKIFEVLLSFIAKLFVAIHEVRRSERKEALWVHEENVSSDTRRLPSGDDGGGGRQTTIFRRAGGRREVEGVSQNGKVEKWPVSSHARFWPQSATFLFFKLATLFGPLGATSRSADWARNWRDNEDGQKCKHGDAPAEAAGEESLRGVLRKVGVVLFGNTRWTPLSCKRNWIHAYIQDKLIHFLAVDSNLEPIFTEV